MNKNFIFFMMCFNLLFGHEGHQHRKINEANQEIVTSLSDQFTVNHLDDRPLTWMQWIGSFHFIFLHFPIALIAMTVISELLFTWFQRPIFDHASRFMLMAAAVFSIPTALLGLTYSFTSSYRGLLSDFIFWHMTIGIATAILAILIAFLRERLGRSKLYFTGLFLLFLMVNITGYLGAAMTFGPYYMHP